MYMLKEDGEEMSLNNEQRNFLVDMGMIEEYGSYYVIKNISITMEDIENQLISMDLID